MVMYGGRIIEQAGVDSLYDEPLHPYTNGLLGSLPVLGIGRNKELVSIPGLPPDPTAMPAGCAFYPRCPTRLDERCATEQPPLREVRAGHWSRCFYDVPSDEAVGR